VLFDAFVTLAEAYAQRGDERLHIEWLARAVRTRPDDPVTLLRLADAEHAAGMLAAARAHSSRVLELRPTHPERARLIARVAAGVPPPTDRQPD
jgi:predicted TPR repeat methyltransferase